MQDAGKSAGRQVGRWAGRKVGRWEERRPLACGRAGVPPARTRVPAPRTPAVMPVPSCPGAVSPGSVHPIGTPGVIPALSLENRQ